MVHDLTNNETKITETTNKEKPMVVDFDLLVDLTHEYQNRCGSLQDVIGLLEMCEIPMSPAVRKLGVVAGVLIK